MAGIAAAERVRPQADHLNLYDWEQNRTVTVKNRERIPQDENIQRQMTETAKHPPESSKSRRKPRSFSNSSTGLPPFESTCRLSPSPDGFFTIQRSFEPNTFGRGIRALQSVGYSTEQLEIIRRQDYQKKLQYQYDLDEQVAERRKIHAQMLEKEDCADFLSRFEKLTTNLPDDDEHNGMGNLSARQKQEEYRRDLNEQIALREKRKADEERRIHCALRPLLVANESVFLKHAERDKLSKQEYAEVLRKQIEDQDRKKKQEKEFDSEFSLSSFIDPSVEKNRRESQREYAQMLKQQIIQQDRLKAEASSKRKDDVASTWETASRYSGGDRFQFNQAQKGHTKKNHSQLNKTKEIENITSDSEYLECAIGNKQKAYRYHDSHRDPMKSVFHDWIEPSIRNEGNRADDVLNSNHLRFRRDNLDSMELYELKIRKAKQEAVRNRLREQMEEKERHKEELRRKKANLEAAEEARVRREVIQLQKEYYLKKASAKVERPNRRVQQSQGFGRIKRKDSNGIDTEFRDFHTQLTNDHQSTSEDELDDELFTDFNLKQKLNLVQLSEGYGKPANVDEQVYGLYSQNAEKRDQTEIIHPNLKSEKREESDNALYSGELDHYSPDFDDDDSQLLPCASRYFLYPTKDRFTGSGEMEDEERNSLNGDETSDDIKPQSPTKVLNTLRRFAPNPPFIASEDSTDSEEFFGDDPSDLQNSKPLNLSPLLSSKTIEESEDSDSSEEFYDSDPLTPDWDSKEDWTDESLISSDFSDSEELSSYGDDED